MYTNNAISDLNSKNQPNLKLRASIKLEIKILYCFYTSRHHGTYHIFSIPSNRRCNEHKIRACNIHVNIYFSKSRITELLLFLKHSGTTQDRSSMMIYHTSQIPVRVLNGLVILAAIYSLFFFAQNFYLKWP